MPASYKRTDPVTASLQGRAYSKNLVLFESVGWLFGNYLELFGVILKLFVICLKIQIIVCL